MGRASRKSKPARCFAYHWATETGEGGGNLIHAPDLGAEGIPDTAEAAVADDADHLRGQIRFAAGAEDGGAAHGDAVQQNSGIRAEPVGQVLRPADAVKAVLDAHGDVVALAEPVCPVVGQEHTEPDGMVEGDVGRKFVPCVGLEAVDSKDNPAGISRSGEEGCMEPEPVPGGDGNLLLGQGFHQGHPLFGQLPDRTVQIKGDVDIGVEFFTGFFPMEIFEKFLAGVVTQKQKCRDQQNNDRQKNVLEHGNDSFLRLGHPGGGACRNAVRRKLPEDGSFSQIVAPEKSFFNPNLHPVRQTSGTAAPGERE